LITMKTLTCIEDMIKSILQQCLGLFCSTTNYGITLLQDKTHMSHITDLIMNTVAP